VFLRDLEGKDGLATGSEQYYLRLLGFFILVAFQRWCFCFHVRNVLGWRWTHLYEP